MSEQKEFIQRFRKEDFGLDTNGRPTGIPEHIRSSFEQALGIVSKDLYSDDLHFVYELIQNAQDNKYADNVTPNLRFILLKDDPTESEGSEGCLCVFNNELGFSEADIKSLCSTGKSTKKQKKAEGYIGEKGIGFKSVFKVSSFPHIFSNGFNFRLLDQDQTTGLSYIIPYWVEDLPEIVKQNSHSTCILLPLRKGKYQDIEDSLRRHKPEITLFLDKLRRVEIDIPANGYSAVFEEKIKEDILYLTSEITGAEPTEQKFLVSRKVVSVPDGLYEEKREGVKERTISAAFPLQPYASLSVFSYLPTEMQSGLPFIINADFLLAASRETINKTKWNDWLFKELSIFVAEKIVRFAKEGTVGSTVYGYIPVPSRKMGINTRFKSFALDVIDLLKPEEFIRTTSGELYRGDSVRSIPKEFRELFSGAEHQLQWLANDLTPYTEGLKQVGVKGLSKSEEEAYYYQKGFIENQCDMWFLKYYDFLKQLRNRSPDNYPVLPLQQGGLTNVNSHSTYKPIELGGSLTDIKGHFFPEIKTIRTSLYNRICNRESSARVFAYLELKDFSFGDYFFEIVLPSVESLDQTASPDDRKSLIEFLLRWWDRLEIDDNLCVSEYGLPVLLNDGELALSEELENDIVYPEGYFQDGRWELIFLNENEKESFNILDGWYSNLIEKSLNNYFEALGVREYPDPIAIKIHRSIELKGHNEYYNDYCKVLDEEFFYNFRRFQSTTTKYATVYLMPSAFWKCNSISKLQYESLIQYFNYLFSKNRNYRFRTRLVWFYRTSKSASIESPIEYYLRESPWLQTQKGLHKPGECFHEDPNLRQIFGNELPYVSVPVPEELLEKFGVRRDAETETVIDYLKQISGGEAISIDASTGIYNALTGRRDLDESVFTENRLIFIPAINGKSSQWCSSAEVIWDDISDLTDDSVFESLELHYPDTLKDFFINRLGVKETIDANIYADLWLNLQSKPKLSDRDWKLYCKAFQNVRLAVNRVEKPEWLLEFKVSAKLYSENNSWVSSDDENAAFLPDLDSLRKEFSKKVPFIKRIDDHPYQWMQSLVSFLGFECFSEVIDEDLVTTDLHSLLPQNRYFTDFSIKLLVRLLANRVSEGREIAEKVKSSGILSNLLNIREAVVDRIKIKLYIPHTAISIVTTDRSVFLDLKENLLYVKDGVDPEDIKDELERLIIDRLLKDISNRQEREAFEDSISKILGVSSRERYRKLWDKKPSWSIPKDILTFIDRLVRDRITHPLEIKSQGTVESNEAESEPKVINDTGSRKGSISERHPIAGGQRDRGSQAEDADHKPSRNEQSGSYSHDNHGQGDRPTSKAQNPVSSGSRTPSDLPNPGQQTSRNSYRADQKPAGFKGNSSRSNNVANAINQGRRSKLRSYVVSELVEPGDEDKFENTTEQKEYRKELGKKAELIVVEDLKAKGFEVVRMPEGNRGYDIEAKNPITGELFFVEVKGDAYAWSDKGVGISRAQYETGLEKRASFFLAVVDNLASVPGSPHYIKDPISYITEYRFDSGWTDLSTPMKPIQSEAPQKCVLEQLLSFTDDPDCQALVQFCDEMAYPFPDIGAELQDDCGAVVLENIELLWENEKIIVFTAEGDAAAAEKYRSSWKIFLAKEQSLIKDALDDIFAQPN